MTGSAVSEVAPGILRVLAPNPSAFTLHGTNSYLVGRGPVAVVDPGPDDPDHLAALLGALAPDDRVAAILVTHAHRDHSALAGRLAAATGAPVLAYGDWTAGRNPRLAALPGLGGGEGVDRAFRPDRRLADGEAVAAGDWRIEALWTPGHMGNHLCFRLGGTVFSGDLVMGWSSSIVSPPDGELAAYRASLARLVGLGAARLLPGHGPPVEAPAARVAELLAHRAAREAAIRDALAAGCRTAAEVVAAVYTDTPPALHPAAARTVLAHLIDLADRGLVRADGPPAPAARWQPA
ncbi:MAG: MBL fold metallo-hydrolase [Rhodobacteraceae bacterium]|jgi:hydroxyacylglutathione hydrolase|nr:MBL fold metallo-hydrolase [Paracoccaceae bacterium]